MFGKFSIFCQVKATLTPSTPVTLVPEFQMKNSAIRILKFFFCSIHGLTARTNHILKGILESKSIFHGPILDTFYIAMATVVNFFPK